MCAVDDCEPWAVVRHDQRTARKEHRCGECPRTIKRGERYEITTGRVAGETQWVTCRVCAHCRAAAGWLEVMCGGWALGGLCVELRDHWRDGYASPVLGRLAAGVRLGWCDGRTPVPEHAAEDARRQLGKVA